MSGIFIIAFIRRYVPIKLKASGKVTAIEAVLRKHAAGNIAAQPALTIDIKLLTLVQLSHSVP